MKKSTFFSIAALLCAFATGAQNADAASYMDAATLDYPSGLYSSMPPSSMDITWDNQEITLINPQTDEDNEKYATVYLQLGEDGEKLPVSAYVMSSFGNPEDPDDTDFWMLDIALYTVDDLFSFEGDIITVSIPEGIVKNDKDEINPAQEFVFHIVPTFVDYTIDPETGSTLTAENLKISVDFDGNPIKYFQSAVRVDTYEPTYISTELTFGNGVSISEDNELIIDLSSFADGDYEVVIPEGFVMITADGKEYISPDLWLEYTIEKGSSDEKSYMDDATLDYPSGLYSSMPPSSMDITWDNQEITLIDPQTDEDNEKYATVYLQLGEDGEKLPVNAYVMSSFGNPEDPDDIDLWRLDIALYTVDDLFSFEGDVITVSIPEGIVKNNEDEINPAQEFVFHIVPTFIDYTIDPETGSTLTAENLKISVDFDGNPIKYFQSAVRVDTFEPTYISTELTFGNGVSISEDNKLVIDLSSFADGDYEVVIPEGFVMITADGKEYISPDLWLEYTIEGNGAYVKEINMAGADLEIFNLQGIKINNAGGFRQLPAGIYIINGKKVYITK